MLSIDAVIERLGGVEAAARLTGVGTEAVRKWRQAGVIPSRHWPAVIGATGLTLTDLQGESPLALYTGETPPGATAVLVLSDGSVFWGRGFGACTGRPAPVGEVWPVSTTRLATCPAP